MKSEKKTCAMCGTEVDPAWSNEIFTGKGKIYYCDKCMLTIEGKAKGSHYLRTKRVQRNRREKK